MNTLLWFEPEGQWTCGHCAAVIGLDGNPAAWLPGGDDGEVICVGCADQIEAAMPPAAA